MIESRLATPRQRPALAVLSVLVFCGLPLLVGCGNDVEVRQGAIVSAGGAGPAGTYDVSFAPAGGHGPGTVWLELGTVDPAAGTFHLLVKGDGLASVFGVAGRLTFDTALCQLAAAEPGDALAGGGNELLAAGAANAQGGVFGVTRSVDWQSSVDVSADQTIGQLDFTIAKTGTSELTFVERRSRVLSENLQPVTVDRWLGGKLTIQ